MNCDVNIVTRPEIHSFLATAINADGSHYVHNRSGSLLYSLSCVHIIISGDAMIPYRVLLCGSRQSEFIILPRIPKGACILANNQISINSNALALET